MADTTIRATAQTQESLVPTFTATIGGVEQLCVDARTLHAHLKNGDLFTNWFNARQQKYGFEEGTDYEPIAWANTKAKKDNETFLENTKKVRMGRPTKDYRISLDMAKELSMVESNEQGRAARRYFINMERIAIQAIKDQLVQALASRPANDYTRISPAQAQALSELVIAETKRTGKHYKTVWGSFNRHFRVNSYHELPAARFDEACQWLGGKRVAAQAVPPAQAPTVAPSYELPAVDFDFMRTMNDGLCDPKPINSAVRAVAQQMSWKLAAEAQVGILQFLERFIAYRTNDAMRQDVSCVAPMLEKLTLSHCLAYRFFEELDRARQMAGLMQQMANTCVNSIQQRMGTVFA